MDCHRLFSLKDEQFLDLFRLENKKKVYDYKSLPLIVINHQTSRFAEEESVGIAGEVEQGICQDLVKTGVMCMAPYIYTNVSYKIFFQAYPKWSLLGKILYNNIGKQ